MKADGQSWSCIDAKPKADKPGCASCPVHAATVVLMMQYAHLQAAGLHRWC